MRAPPESLMPMHGQPVFSARSMILVTFSANTSPRDPPNTDASWLNTKTWRPAIVPQPVITPSPRIRRSSMPKLVVRWSANMSSSVKDPGSSRRSMRSRAVSLPFACWDRSAAPPRWTASYLRLRSMLIFLPVPPREPLVDAPSAAAEPGVLAALTPSPAPTGGTPLRACLLTASGYQGTPRASCSHRDRRSVDAEHLAKRAAHLADGRMRVKRGAHQRQQVVGALGAGMQGIERMGDGRGGPG